MIYTPLILHTQSWHSFCNYVLLIVDAFKTLSRITSYDTTLE